MIRRCGIHELHKLLPMAEQFFLESGEPGTFNPDGFMQHWIETYQQCQGVIFVDNAISCMLGLYIGNNPYSGIIEVNEAFYYSTAGNGGNLLRHVIKWADSMGVKAFYLHHRTEFNADKLSRFYGKLGFKPKFVRYLREG